MYKIGDYVMMVRSNKDWFVPESILFKPYKIEDFGEEPSRFIKIAGWGVDITRVIPYNILTKLVWGIYDRK